MDKKETEHPLEASINKSLLPYKRPALKIYGQLRDLTEGGGSGTTEVMGMGTMMMV